jgi:protein O-mannosyl-transferase
MKKNSKNIKVSGKSNKNSKLTIMDKLLNKIELILIRYFNLISIILIILTGILVYSNSFDCSFNFDDSVNISNNPAIKNLSMFTNINYWLHPGRQIAYLSFALNYHFNNLDVFGYHLINILIHIITGISTFLLVKLILNLNNSKNIKFNKYKDWIALFSALFFVVHPLQTQAVTYIVQRMASMAAMFYILSIYLYALGRIEHTQKNNILKAIIFYFLALTSGIIGVMTKENAATFPITMLLFEFTFIRNTENKIYKKYIIISSSVIAFLCISYFFLNPSLMTSAATSGIKISSQEYLINQFIVIARYLQLTILPFNQCADYGNVAYNFPFVTSFWRLDVIGCFLLLAGLIVMAVIVYKKNKILSFGIFWLFLTLSVESSIIPIAEPMFEHRMYLPMLGIGLFLVYSLFLLFSKIKPIYIFSFLSVLILVLGISGYSRNKIWKNELSLWTDVIKNAPYNARGYFNRGTSKEKLEDKEGAIRDYKRAIEIKPDYSNAYNHRANLKAKLGDLEGAIKDYSRVIEIKPEFADAYYNRGKHKNDIGDKEGAMNDFNQAIELKQDFIDAYINRGVLKKSLNDNNGAIMDYNKAIELNPKDTIVYNNRGNVKFKLGDYEGAIKDYIRAIEIKPDYAEAYNGLASSYFNMKDFNKAIYNYKKAIEIDPHNLEAIKNLELSKQSLENKR